jgi:Protein of unknown function (DUF2652)/Polyketide cyclase / dehydrase and lipid transport
MGNDSNNRLSLLFIPDISGFTQFVAATEISHSQHIIAELLEIIIDSNQLGLTLSEIEGDAVMFYGFKKVPSLEDILLQAKDIFIAFHTHLKRYKNDRICDCGACSTASQLTLKIFVHVGEFTLIDIKDQQKPYGPDVILIHRLMKNDIPKDDYLMITSTSYGSFTNQDLGEHQQWANIETGHSSYQNLGKIDYQYIGLSPLLQWLPDPETIPLGKKISNPVINEIYIHRPVSDVYEFISNLELKSKWVQGLDRMEFDRGKLNRQGSKHLCIVDSKELNFETVLTDFGENTRVFGERLTNAPLMKEILSYFIFTPEGKGTKLRAEVHCIPKPVLGWLIKPLLKTKISQNIKKGLESLKHFSEKEMQ